MSLRALDLVFSVSRDEEFVRLEVFHDASRFDLGARAYHYLLLTLARQRARDAASYFSDASSGWVDQEELANDPTMAPAQVNIGVFRIRRRLVMLGVADAYDIVERRPSTRQLRIGTARIAIHRI